jgi:hypothetical protein
MNASGDSVYSPRASNEQIILMNYMISEMSITIGVILTQDATSVD